MSVRTWNSPEYPAEWESDGGCFYTLDEIGEIGFSFGWEDLAACEESEAFSDRDFECMVFRTTLDELVDHWIIGGYVCGDGKIRDGKSELRKWELVFKACAERISKAAEQSIGDGEESE